MTEKQLPVLQKAASGIQGLDEVTGGGLPQGRPTLVTGNAGCGKTLLAMEFLVNGITEYGEAGVFIAFEESKEDLMLNVASLGYDVAKLIDDKQLYIDHVQVERSEIEETGEYDLEGLFIRLGYAIDRVGAKRVVLDTIEALFSGFENTAVLRAELRRLFRWLKDRGVTAVITGERGDLTLTRQGLEEYVSDCVIILDHRVNDQVSTRRLRVMKYRGSTHGTNEYPFLIDNDGITVMPITSLRLDHSVSSERISTGIAPLDDMLGGGLYKGASVLLSGTSGTGKTSISVTLASAACQRGEKCLYLAFEESPAQIIRNAGSINVDLDKYIARGLLHFEASRSTSQGLETHLAIVHKLIAKYRPEVVIVDPITNLITTGNAPEVRAMLTRLMDMFKAEGITALFTSLTQSTDTLEHTDFGVSSLVDTWILLRDLEVNAERNRLIYVLKSRGTAHSNQLRELLISSSGIDLAEVYIGNAGLLTGTARLAEEARAAAADRLKLQESARRQRAIKHKRQIIEAQINSLKAELDNESEEMDRISLQEQEQRQIAGVDAAAIRVARLGGKK